MGPMSDATGDRAAHSTPGDATGRVDGRKAWRVRNRLAVVDALLDLYAEGNLRPDAQEVAARSGVSRRSVFRYFDDRDDLDRAAIERQQERVKDYIDIPAMGEGTLAERIARIADQRVALFARLGPAARVSRLRAPFHRVIGEGLEQSRRYFGRQVERQFAPELGTMEEAARREALAVADTLCSFETYDFLCGRGLEAAEVREAIQRGLVGLFAQRRD